LSCGAALAHLSVALRSFGYAGEIALLPDSSKPDLLASVALGRPHAGTREHQLLAAIDKRHTHRGRFDDRPIPHEILAQLTRDTHHAGATLHVLTDDEPKDAVATLVEEGDHAQFSDAGFRRELAAWIRPNRTRRSDGMPGYTFGVSDLASVLRPTMIASFDTGARRAKRDGQIARAVPALVVVSTDGDTPADWLTTGQAVAVLLLRATAHGLAASFLNQPIEVPELRVRFRNLLGGDDTPQLLLRLGYGTAARPTPRRTVDDVLINANGRAGTRQGQAGRSPS
jgi:hypothetical protein